MSNAGGKRAGAGRPKLLVRPESIALRLDGNLHLALLGLQGRRMRSFEETGEAWRVVTLSELIREAIREKLEREKVV